MKQHSIQEAYFKPFEDKSRNQLWGFFSEKKDPVTIPAKKCTMEIDFQSETREQEQNREIETQGIRAIRSADNKKLDDSIIENIFKWTSLHFIRNQNNRKNSQNNYNQDYNRLYETEKKYSYFFNDARVFSCNENDFFITSDNPVTEINDKGVKLIHLTLSPKNVIIFSNVKFSFLPWIPEIGIAKTINAQIFANKYKYVFSHSRNLPIQQYIENAKKYNLKGNFEDKKFYIEKKSS